MLKSSERVNSIRLTTDVLKVSEAESTRDDGPGHEATLRISFACNQNCGFCFVDLSKTIVPLREIESSLDLMSPHARAAEYLVISGGEPTTHPDLPKILRLCRKKGFARILIQTNGVLLSKQNAAEKLGTLTYLISFHSHRPDIYDQLTRSKRQFKPAVQGIRNILKIDANTVILNIIINNLNYTDLPDHIDFIAGLREGRPISVFFSMLNDVGLVKTPQLAVDLRMARPFINEALKRCRKKGVNVMSFTGNCAPPVCQTDKPASYRSRSKYSQGDVQYLDDFTGADGGGRAKSLSCRNCSCDQYCRGVPVDYAKRFGVSMLRPVART